MSSFKLLRISVIALLVAFLSTSLSASPAWGANKVFSTFTPLDTYNRPAVNPQYDIERVEVGLLDNDLDQVHFWIKFKSPLKADQFNDGRGSWAGIFIDTNNDGQEDLQIDTRNYTYSENYWQPADASKNCTAVSWMNLDAGKDNVWLGFKVSQKCWGLPNKFWVQAYAEYDQKNNGDSFDNAPDAFAQIDLGDYYNPKPKVTTVVPKTTLDFGQNLSNYSTPPTNLSTLVSTLKQSVVTIECKYGSNSGTGSAWSAKVTLPSPSAYSSYLITNYHVISDCIYRGTVDVLLSNGTKVTGYLASWDPANDLAGIYVSQLIPPLIWRGPTPMQGGWVGVIGSPLGLPSVLTTGIVSSVSENESLITFTAPINPGNSGGPVFDAIGRVIAIATAKARESEGFGIGNGAPLICKVILACEGNRAWTGASVVVSNTNPKVNETINIVYGNPTLKTAKVGKSVRITGTASVGEGDIIIYMKKVGTTRWIEQAKTLRVFANGTFSSTVLRPKFDALFRVQQEGTGLFSNQTVVTNK